MADKRNDDPPFSYATVGMVNHSTCLATRMPTIIIGTNKRASVQPKHRQHRDL